MTEVPLTALSALPVRTETPEHSVIVLDETAHYEGAEYHLTTQDCAR